MDIMGLHSYGLVVPFSILILNCDRFVLEQMELLYEPYYFKLQYEIVQKLNLVSYFSKLNDGLSISIYQWIIIYPKKVQEIQHNLMSIMCDSYYKWYCQTPLESK